MSPTLVVAGEPGIHIGRIVTCCRHHSLLHDYVQYSKGVPPTACAASWILRVAFAVAACVPVVDVAEASEGEAATTASACALAADTT